MHARGKKVVIIGGGDTGADCLGTSHRQGAESSTSSRSCRVRRRSVRRSTPWPTYPLMFRVSSAHEEGGERVFSVNTEKFVGEDGKVTGLKATRSSSRTVASRRSRAPTSTSMPTSCFLAMGFVGPEKPGLLTDLGVDFDERGNVSAR